MYLTYDEYVTEYGGTIDEATFTQYAFKAQKAIDKVTACRVEKMKEVPVAVKMCMNELIKLEVIYNANVATVVEGTANGGNGSGKLISSFSNDGYSETYSSGQSDVGSYLFAVRKALDKNQAKMIGDYLVGEYDDFGVPLLYRGVR
jgi:hypothetical protein